MDKKQCLGKKIQDKIDLELFLDLKSKEIKGEKKKVTKKNDKEIWNRFFQKINNTYIEDNESESEELNQINSDDSINTNVFHKILQEKKQQNKTEKKNNNQVLVKGQVYGAKRSFLIHREKSDFEQDFSKNKRPKNELFKTKVMDKTTNINDLRNWSKSNKLISEQTYILEGIFCVKGPKIESENSILIASLLDLIFFLLSNKRIKQELNEIDLKILKRLLNVYTEFQSLEGTGKNIVHWLISVAVCHYILKFSNDIFFFSKNINNYFPSFFVSLENEVIIDKVLILSKSRFEKLFELIPSSQGLKLLIIQKILENKKFQTWELVKTLNDDICNDRIKDLSLLKIYLEFYERYFENCNTIKNSDFITQFIEKFLHNLHENTFTYFEVFLMKIFVLLSTHYDDEKINEKIYQGLFLSSLILIINKNYVLIEKKQHDKCLFDVSLFGLGVLINAVELNKFILKKTREIDQNIILFSSVNSSDCEMKYLVGFNAIFVSYLKLNLFNIEIKSHYLIEKLKLFKSEMDDLILKDKILSLTSLLLSQE